MSNHTCDAAAATAPREGMGLAVANGLTSKIASGEITRLCELPTDYRKLGQSCGLPE